MPSLNTLGAFFLPSLSVASPSCWSSEFLAARRRKTAVRQSCSARDPGRGVDGVSFVLGCWEGFFFFPSSLGSAPKVTPQRSFVFSKSVLSPPGAAARRDYLLEELDLVELRVGQEVCGGASGASVGGNLGAAPPPRDGEPPWGSRGGGRSSTLSVALHNRELTLECNNYAAFGNLSLERPVVPSSHSFISPFIGLVI